MKKGRIGAIALCVSTGCYQGYEADAGWTAGHEVEDDAPPEGDDEDDGGDAEPEPPSSTSVTFDRLWRLTWDQYDGSVSALLGSPSNASQNFPVDLLKNAEYGFSNEATSMELTPQAARELANAAGEIAAQVGQQLPTLSGCEETDEACLRDYASGFAARAYRRALAPDEQTRLVSLYDAARVEFTTSEAVAIVVESVLRSPHFLFRVEVGEGEGDTRRLPDEALASALALTLWNALPDDELRDQAQAGGLQDSVAVAQQVRRMLWDPRGVALLESFVPQWLQLKRPVNLHKENPSFDEDTARSLLAGTGAFVRWVASEQEWSLGALLTEPVAFADEDSRWIYGTAADDASAEGMHALELDPERYAGILSQAAFSASHATSTDSSFVSRGLVISERLLCFSPPPPPPDAPTELPPANDELQTARERFEWATSGADCKGCHVMFTPLGFAYETFDAVGAWRDTDNGGVIDTAGITPLSPSSGSEFDDAVDLANLLVSGDELPQCVSRQMFRFAYGRHESSDADEAAIERAAEVFIDADLDLRELLVALLSDTHFARRDPAPS